MIPTPLPTPALDGVTWEEIRGVDWTIFRELLAAATPMSGGTRRGYRPGGTSYPDSRLTAQASADFVMRGAPGWWRPSPGVVLLAVPYYLPGPNGGDSIAFFGPAESGLRYVDHVQEPTSAGCEDLGGPPSGLVGTMEDDRQVFVGWACSDEYIRVRLVQFREGEIVVENHDPSSGMYEETAMGEGDEEE